MAKRIELKPCSVVFNPDDHSYYLPEKDKFLSGITGMLERQLFPDTYAGIPDAVLAQAAAYGTEVHASCEDFDANWINDGTQEVADYIQICKDNGLVHEASEYTVSDGNDWASNIDKVFRVSDNTFDICDIKTYGVMTHDKREKARWQLSIYAYLFELQNKKAKVDRLIVIHLRNKPKKDGTFDHISTFTVLPRIPSEICKDLLDAVLAGEQFINPYSIPEEIKQQESLIRKLILAKTEAETQLSEIKARILNAMEAQGIRTWATESMKITRKLPTTRSSFSLADFKVAHSDIDIEPYMKVSPVAGSLTITI